MTNGDRQLEQAGLERRVAEHQLQVLRRRGRRCRTWRRTSSVMPPEATLNRRSRNRLRSSIGCLAVDSRQMNRPMATAATAKAPSVVGDVQPLCGPSMIAVDERRRGRRSTAPRQARRAGARSGSFDVGRRIAPAMSGDDDHRHVDEEHRAPPEVLEQQPDVIGPMATPAPDMPAQMAMACGRSWAGKTLVRIDRVDGMMNAAAEAHDRPGGDHLSRRVRERGEDRADQEQHEADLQGALAAEAVAEGAGGEEHAGEHQRVGVDHPLQRRRRCVEVAGQRRHRHVEAWCCR